MRGMELVNQTSLADQAISSGEAGATAVPHPELRTDPLSGRCVLVAPGRASRPGAFAKSRPEQSTPEQSTPEQSTPEQSTPGQSTPGQSTPGQSPPEQSNPVLSQAHADHPVASLIVPGCPFCRGAEAETPPETLRIPAADAHDGQASSPEWRVRVIGNKYPAVRPPQEEAAFTELQAEPWTSSSSAEELSLQNPLLQNLTLDNGSQPGFGWHEVLIESGHHTESITELKTQQLAEVLQAAQQRIEAASGWSWAKYPQLFKNVGTDAGASLAHSHSQLVILPFVPNEVSIRLQRSQRYYRQTGRCLVCDFLAAELQGPRIVQASEHFVALCPAASRMPYETWILPRRHCPDFRQSSAEELQELADLWKSIIGRVERATGRRAYNCVWQTAPFDPSVQSHYHWVLEVLPRVTRIAGFEFGSGCFITPLTPEFAAADLRDCP